jgi:hypothetical protein
MAQVETEIRYASRRQKTEVGGASGSRKSGRKMVKKQWIRGMKMEGRFDGEEYQEDVEVGTLLKD